ncbi:MAG: HAD family phosphatase [Ktedonobacteraceae bacterium]|nr:HAD family phosphatase [Ktedonobacteraceae bacterium]
MKVTSPDIKLLAIDIDGTLLTPDRRITPRTRAMVQAAQQAGIVVTLATGRRYCNSAPMAAELALTIPLIICDGATIIQHPDGNVLHTHLLNADVAQQAVEMMIRHMIQPVVHYIEANGTEETWTGPLEQDNEWITPYFAAFPENIRRLPHNELCSGQSALLRVVALASENIIYNGLAQEVAALHCAWNMIPLGNYGSAELAVMHMGCSKANGVRALAQRLNIPLENVMAIGDNNNDIEMLQEVGWGVAMGHANTAVKAAAKVITSSNTEDGVALAIERYVLRRAASADSNSLKREICF